jgi:GTPase SAR1 family protein
MTSVSHCCIPSFCASHVDGVACAGRRESFEHVQSWYDRAKQLGGQDIEPVLIGNKMDLDSSVRQVSAKSQICVQALYGRMG